MKTSLDTTAFPLKCPKCGQLEESKVDLCDRDLRRRNFVILPVHPLCRSCSTELECTPDDRGNRNSFAVILTGTCGSGKSAVSEFLMCHHDFTVIDGDCVMSVVEHRRGDKDFQFNGTEVFDEIAKEIEILRCLGKKIVISHVIEPQDLTAYEGLLNDRKISSPDGTDFVAKNWRANEDNAWEAVNHVVHVSGWRS